MIDELPHLVLQAPELPSALQHFVDHDAKHAEADVDALRGREPPPFARGRKIVRALFAREYRGTEAKGIMLVGTDDVFD